MWSFRLFAVNSCPDSTGRARETTQKGRSFQTRFRNWTGSFLASCEPAASNTIDTVRDAASFPGRAVVEAGI
jgi:hypothetical protein